MRLVTVRSPTGTRAAQLLDGRVAELDAPDVGALLAAGPGWSTAPARTHRGPSVDDVDLAPPVVRPPKIICLGLNYETHIRELGRDLPDHPTIFAKYARALIGPHDPIVLPRVGNQVDWEAELAFVMARAVRHARPGEAAAAIAGYTILNDVSVRDWQWRTPQWLQGKTFEATTPLGPALVTPDEVDHGADLAITCEVDGRTMQSARTSDLLFKPVDIVCYLSAIITLEPGDVIATGTPGGVGAGRDPQVFLRPGQVVRTAIEGLGELRNTCVAEDAMAPEPERPSHPRWYP